MQRAKAGDPAAFDQLVERYTPRLYRVIRRMASDQGEAEAIVQEAWLRAWRALSRYDDDRPIYPWLMRIAVNVTRDIWRKKRPVDFADIGEVEDIFPDPQPGPEQRLTRQETLDRLADGVENLRPEFRLVIGLRYEEGFAYEEIAELLGVPLNTVRTHLHRAKKELRDWMEQADD